MLGKKLAKIKLQNGNRPPKVCFDESVIQTLSLPWQDALVVKLLGKHLGFMAMRERLKGLWKLKAGFR